MSTFVKSALYVTVLLVLPYLFKKQKNRNDNLNLNESNLLDCAGGCLQEKYLFSLVCAYIEFYKKKKKKKKE